jgi:hypothetical protein
MLFFPVSGQVLALTLGKNAYRGTQNNKTTKNFAASSRISQISQ